MFKLFTYLLFFVSVNTFSQTQTFQIYSSKGKKISIDKMMTDLQKSDVVLFGELHNNVISHYLQVKLAKHFNENSNKKLIIGAEMFERDQDSILNAFLKNKINEHDFEKSMRLWPNYNTDYKPLLMYAKEKNISYIATNVPRRYASLLFKKGEDALDTISFQEKKWIAPLPFPYDKNLPGYVKMLDMFKDSGHANENFPKAQAIKDATMGYFICQNIKENSIFLHLNGSYHSDNYEGVFWYINKYKPNLKIKTISTVEQVNVSELEKEYLEKADYIIVVDADMPHTYE